MCAWLQVISGILQRSLWLRVSDRMRVRKTTFRWLPMPYMRVGDVRFSAENHLPAPPDGVMNVVTLEWPARKGLHQMKLTSIDSKNRMQAECATEMTSKEPGRHFASEEEWTRIASELPLSRLLEIWNALPNITPARRFPSRQAAVRRIWKAVQRLQPRGKGTVRPPNARTTSHARQIGRNVDPGPSKKSQVIALLGRADGVSLEQIADLTGWQKHTIRGFLSGTLHKKMCLEITATKNAHGTRTYHINRDLAKYHSEDHVEAGNRSPDSRGSPEKP